MLYYVHTNKMKNIVSAFKSIKNKSHIWNTLPVPMTITSYLDGKSSSMINIIAGFHWITIRNIQTHVETANSINDDIVN
jgi:hypothetical protein